MVVILEGGAAVIGATLLGVAFYFSIKQIKGWGSRTFLNTQLQMYKTAFEDGEKRHEIERQRWQEDLAGVKRELAQVKGQLDAYSDQFADNLTNKVLAALKSDSWFQGGVGGVAG